ncbi:hypothetical protein JTB14_027720 [Gonioctena quinquepunctata]|nr:hypothetical protein JTB14_027720 [Gonioctena quinquepunctata]
MADILPSGSEDENQSDSDDYVPNPNTKDDVSSDEGDISVSDSEDEEPLSNVSARGKQKYTWTQITKQKFSNQVKPQMLCVDEQKVPFKRMSSLKQYNPKTPNKWGYKVFVLCDSGGLIHNFEVYTGKILPASGKEDIAASGNIVRLASIISKHKNYLLFFDNWFTSIKLLTTLQMDGIYCLGKIRKDSIPGLQFPNDKIMK